MNAPLPEVPAHSPRKRDSPKVAPLSLSICCALKIIFAILLPILHTPDPKVALLWDWTVHGTFAVLDFWLLLNLWRGYLWARGVWLWLTVFALPFALISMFSTSRIPSSLAYQIAVKTSFGISLFLLIYLNLPKVKAHFKTQKPLQ